MENLLFLGVPILKHITVCNLKIGTPKLIITFIIKFKQVGKPSLIILNIKQVKMNGYTFKGCNSCHFYFYLPSTWESTQNLAFSNVT